MNKNGKKRKRKRKWEQDEDNEENKLILLKKVDKSSNLFECNLTFPVAKSVDESGS